METTSHTAQSRPGWPVFVGIFVLLLLFIIAGKLLLGLVPPAPDEDAARGEERAKALVALQTENQAKLETYAWADKAKGTVQIPIERAKAITIAQLNTTPPQAAGPVTPPPAAVAPAPTTPSPSATTAPSPAAQPAPTN